METNKEKALNWIDTFYKQREENLHHDLIVEVNNKHVPSIISLAQDLGNIKEVKATVIEQIQDAETLVDLVQLIMDDSLFEDGDKEEYLIYIFSI
jgi:pyruvate-formate lyase-activating enzyme